MLHSSQFSPIPGTETPSFRAESLPAFIHDWVARTPLGRVSLSQLTTRNWELDEDLAAISNLGFGGIGLWRPKLASFGLEKSIDLIVESQISVASVSWAGAFTGSHGFSFRDAVADGMAAIRLAAAVSAETVIVAPGTKRTHIRSHAFRLVIEGFRALCDFAAESGVKLAIVPAQASSSNGLTFIDSIPMAMEVIEGVNSPSVGLCLNTHALSRSLPTALPLQGLLPYLFGVQLCDSCRPDDLRRPDLCLPGGGQLPLANLVQTLLTSGYEGFFEVQVPSPEIWNSNYERLLPGCRCLLGRIFGDSMTKAT